MGFKYIPNRQFINGILDDYLAEIERGSFITAGNFSDRLESDPDFASMRSMRNSIIVEFILTALSKDYENLAKVLMQDFDNILNYDILLSKAISNYVPSYEVGLIVDMFEKSINKLPTDRAAAGLIKKFITVAATTGNDEYLEIVIDSKRFRTVLEDYNGCILIYEITRSPINSKTDYKQIRILTEIFPKFRDATLKKFTNDPESLKLFFPNLDIFLF